MAESQQRVCSKHGLTIFAKYGPTFRCRKCSQSRVSEQRRKNKRVLVEEHGGKCVLCGYDRYPGALQFHHLDPSQKEFGITVDGKTRSLEEMRAEAKKCILVCANCHAEIEGGFVVYSGVPSAGTMGLPVKE